MTHQEINAARLTLAKRIIERLIEDPYVKLLRMWGPKNIGPTIISVITEVVEAWTPEIITEDSLQAALKDQEWEVRVRFILATGGDNRADAESVASMQLLQET
jgi:hypothetical protein